MRTKSLTRAFREEGASRSRASKPETAFRSPAGGAFEEEEERDEAFEAVGADEFLARSAAGALPVRAKLQISEPGDELEREADRVAEDLVAAPEGEQVEVKRQPATSSGGGEASPAAAKAVGALRGGGAPLSDSARSFFEPRMGTDLSDVRVHTGPAAADAASSINAQAFTYGRDIAFGEGKWYPDTPAGRKLLAHELAHVGQKDKDSSSTIAHRAITPMTEEDEVRTFIERIHTAISNLTTPEEEEEARKQSNVEMSSLFRRIVAVLKTWSTDEIGVEKAQKKHLNRRGTRKELPLSDILPGHQFNAAGPKYQIVTDFRKEEKERRGGTFVKSDGGGAIRFYHYSLAEKSDNELSGTVAHEISHLMYHAFEILKKAVNKGKRTENGPPIVGMESLELLSFPSDYRTRFETLIEAMFGGSRLNRRMLSKCYQNFINENIADVFEERAMTTWKTVETLLYKHTLKRLEKWTGMKLKSDEKAKIAYHEMELLQVEMQEFIHDKLAWGYIARGSPPELSSEAGQS